MSTQAYDKDGNKIPFALIKGDYVVRDFQTVEQLQAQIASLTAEIERLTNAATNLLSALREYRTFKPNEDCDGWEDERMRIFETLNMTEAELIAALQPKEGV